MFHKLGHVLNGGVPESQYVGVPSEYVVYWTLYHSYCLSCWVYLWPLHVHLVALIGVLLGPGRYLFGFAVP